MFAILNSILLFTAETGGHAAAKTGGLQAFYDNYLNIPGFEAWKFVNLTIFVLIMVYLLKKPLSSAFKAKREAIRADLIKAEQEKQAALAQLTTAEARLVALENERAAILERSRNEAEAEKARLIAETEAEIKKLREQTAAEIARLGQQTRAELRRFSAEESVRRAEARLRSQIDAEKDGRLVKAGITAIGGLN